MSADVSIRQHTSAYVSMYIPRAAHRRRAEAAACIRAECMRRPQGVPCREMPKRPAAYVAYVSIRQHTSAYVSIVSIRQHTSASSAYAIQVLLP